jgi:hypothetical protein
MREMREMREINKITSSSDNILLIYTKRVNLLSEPYWE